MKTLASILLTMALLSGAAEKARPPYDADLARKLGADDRGMKMYALVLLKTGPRKDLPKEESDRAFAGHMANINPSPKPGNWSSRDRLKRTTGFAESSSST